MRTLQIGLRRLYLAPCCTVVDGRAICVEKTFGETAVVVRVSAEPRFGVTVIEGLQLPFVTDRSVPAMFKMGVPSAETQFSGYTFTELLCTRSFDVEDTEYNALKSQSGGAVNRVIEHAGSMERELEVVADAVVGIIGLKLHLQLVKMLLSRELVACDGDACLGRSLPGHYMEVLNAVNVNDDTRSVLDALLGHIAELDRDAFSKVSDIMYWLTRAWSDRSPSGQLVELFVILEMLVDGIGKEEAAPSPSAELLRDFIVRAKTENAKDLLDAVADLDDKREPSLPQRFEALAARTPNAQRDIAAFRAPNIMNL
jgi:hypothetical protein